MSLEQAIADVRAFHEACDVPVLKSPRLPDTDRRALRMKLLVEELTEFRESLCASDLEGCAQELADLIYVAIGAGLEFGLPLGEVWRAIHEANMAKADPVTGKVTKREDGKVLKPDGWQPANIKALF
jgi:predicted HAD superfamily Cof-like phosphohydrolase